MDSLSENNGYLAVASAVAFTIAVIAVWVIREVARRYRPNWLYHPKAERWNGHIDARQSVIAVRGGAGIYLAIVVALGFCSLVLSNNVFLNIAILATGALALGWHDDRNGCSPWLKLFVQGSLGLGTALTVGMIEGFPVVIAVPLTVVCVVGFMNAVNMMDNMDGAASGLVALAAVGYALLGWLTNNAAAMTLSVVIASVSVGFLVFNYPPASVFMGDMGSMLLGYLLAVTSILSTHGQFAHDLVRWIAPSLIVALFVTDVILVVSWRRKMGLRVMRGGVHHMTHRLAILFGRSERKAILSLYAAQIFLILVALLVAGGSLVGAVLALLLMSVGLGLLGWRLWYVLLDDRATSVGEPILPQGVNTSPLDRS